MRDGSELAFAGWGVGTCLLAHLTEHGHAVLSKLCQLVCFGLCFHGLPFLWASELQLLAVGKHQAWQLCGCIGLFCRCPLQFVAFGIAVCVDELDSECRRLARVGPEAGTNNRERKR